MKKSTFFITISVAGETKKVRGLVSNNFGIHKNEADYAVTHLRTGGKISDFPRQRQARDFIERLEQGIFPVPWDKIDTPEKATPNKDKTREIYFLCT